MPAAAAAGVSAGVWYPFRPNEISRRQHKVVQDSDINARASKRTRGQRAFQLSTKLDGNAEHTQAVQQ